MRATQSILLAGRMPESSKLPCNEPRDEAGLSYPCRTCRRRVSDLRLFGTRVLRSDHLIGDPRQGGFRVVSRREGAPVSCSRSGLSLSWCSTCLRWGTHAQRDERARGRRASRCVHVDVLGVASAGREARSATSPCLHGVRYFTTSPRPYDARDVTAHPRTTTRGSHAFSRLRTSDQT